MKKELKLKNFFITGKSHQINCLAEDLKEIGYLEPYKGSGDTILCNNSNYSEPEKLKMESLIEIYKTSNISSTRQNQISFKLPEEYNVALNFLQNQYNDIKEYFKEEEFKKGDWIYFKDSDTEGLFRFKDKENRGDYNTYYYSEFYKLNSYLTSFNITNNSTISNNRWEKTFKLATKEEILRLLILAAKEKGFIDGAKVNRPSNHKCTGQIDTIKDFIFTYDEQEDSLVKGGVTVYYKGEWGKVIEKEKLIIQGFNIQILDSDLVKFGCVEVNRGDLNNLLIYINNINQSSTTTRKIKSIDLDSNITVTVEEIEKIVNYLHDNNK